MNVMINQPCPFPTLYLWNRVVRSDVVVHLVSAQFIRRQAKGSHAFVNAYEVQLRDGRRHKLTVPTLHVGTQEQAVADVIIDYGQQWVERHVKTVEQNYRKAKYFDEVFPLYRTIVDAGYPTMAMFSMASFKIVLDYLGLQRRVVTDRALAPIHSDEPSQWMCELVRVAGGDKYVCGQWAIDNYIRVAEWTGIEVVGQNWQCPEYRQVDQFEPNLSILDLLFYFGRGSLTFLK